MSEPSNDYFGGANTPEVENEQEIGGNDFDQRAMNIMDLVQRDFDDSDSSISDSTVDEDRREHPGFTVGSTDHTTSENSSNSESSSNNPTSSDSSMSGLSSSTWQTVSESSTLDGSICEQFKICKNISQKQPHRINKSTNLLKVLHNNRTSRYLPKNTAEHPRYCHPESDLNKQFNKKFNKSSNSNFSKSQNTREFLEKVRENQAHNSEFPTISPRSNFSFKIDYHKRAYTSFVRRFKPVKFVRPRHGGCVNALDWSEDGNMLASAGDDRKVLLTRLNMMMSGTGMTPSCENYLKFPTQHVSNIFQCKFLPLSMSKKMVTTANDGVVLLHDLQERKSSKLLDPTHELYSGAIHRIICSKNDTEILAACENNRILRIDTREGTVRNLTDHDESARIKVDRSRSFRLYSVDRNPVKPWEIACGGSGSLAAGLLDLRFLKVYQEGGRKFFKHVNVLRPDALETVRKQYKLSQDCIWKSVTALKYSKNGKNLVVNNCPGNIVLYDVNNANVKNNIADNVVNTYNGHQNITTVKGVSFYGDDDEFVLSGSDCGRLFFWDKVSKEVVTCWQGDEDILNVICPHPSQPVIATSGIDNDVKLWMPSGRKVPSQDHIKNVVMINERKIRRENEQFMRSSLEDSIDLEAIMAGMVSDGVGDSDDDSEGSASSDEMVDTDEMNTELEQFYNQLNRDIQDQDI